MDYVLILILDLDIAVDMPGSSIHWDVSSCFENMGLGWKWCPCPTISFISRLTFLLHQ